MTALTLGVDPGKSGALALLTPDSQLLDVIDMPEHIGHALGTQIRWILEEVAPHTIAKAYIEQAQAMPKQGVSSTFTYGCSYGALCGALGALKVPAQFVRPTVWKKAMGLSSKKASSLSMACNEWPDEAHRFARKRDDGRAEASLIGLWGQRFGGAA